MRFPRGSGWQVTTAEPVVFIRSNYEHGSNNYHHGSHQPNRFGHGNSSTEEFVDWYPQITCRMEKRLEPIYAPIVSH